MPALLVGHWSRPAPASRLGLSNPRLDRFRQLLLANSLRLFIVDSLSGSLSKSIADWFCDGSDTHTDTDFDFEPLKRAPFRQEPCSPEHR